MKQYTYNLAQILLICHQNQGPLGFISWGSNSKSVIYDLHGFMLLLGFCFCRTDDVGLGKTVELNDEGYLQRLHSSVENAECVLVCPWSVGVLVFIK